MALRVGLIGCGIISAAHRRGWATVADRAAIVACCDTDLDRAAATAAPLGARPTDDYRDVLADPGIDAVDLCLPHHLHDRVAVAALDAGKHVLCEKPMATTLAGCDAMAAAAERAGRVLMIAESARFQPGLSEARALLDSGAIGEVIALHATSAWYQGGPYLDTAWRFDPAQMGGGALIDGGIHAVDVVVALLGRPTRVSCLTRRVREIFPAEDTALLAIEFADGALADLTVHWSARHTPHVLAQISGTEGTLFWTHAGLQVVGERVEGGRREVPIEPADSFVTMVAHFVDCVETGARPRMGPMEGRLDVALVLAAYESARTGQVVAVT